MADTTAPETKADDSAPAADAPALVPAPIPESGHAADAPVTNGTHAATPPPTPPVTEVNHGTTAASASTPVTVIGIEGIKPIIPVVHAPASVTPRPLAPAPDSPFAPDTSGGAVASASHLPALHGLTPVPLGASGSGQARILPYMPMPSGIIPMPSGAAWQKVNQQIPVTPPQPVLLASGLRKKFGKREVVRGVDIQVGPGEIVGLLGRNGAGKTTTFRMIMGLLHPDQGKVMYENRDISRMPMYERANRGIGYLAQQPSIFQRLTVEDNLLAILELQEKDKKKRYTMLESLITDLGLNTVRKSMASVLSGGERRRLEIARAMSLRPRVVLFDEPFAGIDPIAVSEIQGILRDLKGQGVGVLLTDHNVRETLTITDRTYIMDEGTIWIHGPPREIVANPDARARYLGHDFRLDF